MNPDDSAAAFEFGETEPLSVDMPGMRVGEYVLLQLIGEGSYGHVWRAKEQGPVTREVAVKILRRTVRTPEIEARFLQEVQLMIDLARHPGIATLHSTGRTKDGRLFFAMELVPGAPITTFCDDRKLTLRQRLDLFRQVCDAVHYAHSINVIHRDLKPSNILAGVRPGAGGDPDCYFIKLIDFGIAKVSGGRLLSAAIATDLNQAVGTAGYMAPEQARPGLSGIDPRSDVYSLGVVLYELLVGLTPFTRSQIVRAMSSGLLEFLRSVDPPLPSTRLLGRDSNSADKDEPDASTIADARRDEIQSLLSVLRGDLSYIPLHAMRKQASDRYRTAAELGADIANYMEGRPLIAGPRTFWYQGRTFVRRFARTFAVLAVIAGCIIGALVVSSVAAVVATRARIEAVVQREAARLGEYRATILAAYGLLFQQDALRAASMLDSTPPELRGWEHRYLRTHLPSSGVIHTEDLPAHVSVEGPDVLRLLGERELTFLTRSTRAETKPERFPTPDYPLSLSIAQDSSGDWGINASLDRSRLYLIDVRQKKVLRPIPLPAGTTDPVVAIAPDGSRYAVSGKEGTSTQIRTLEDDALLAELSRSGAVALTNSTLLVAGKQVWAFDARTGEERGCVVPYPGIAAITRIHADGTGRLALLVGESMCELWDLQTQSVRWRCALSPRDASFTGDLTCVHMAARSALYVLSTQPRPGLRVFPVEGAARFVGQIPGTSEIWISSESHQNSLYIIPQPVIDTSSPTPVNLRGGLVLSPTAPDFAILDPDRRIARAWVGGVRQDLSCIGVPAFSASGDSILLVAEGKVKERQRERVVDVCPLPADLPAGALAAGAVFIQPSVNGDDLALLSVGDEEVAVHVFATSNAAWKRLNAWPVPEERRATQSRHGALAWSQEGLLAAAFAERVAVLSPGSSNVVRVDQEFKLSAKHVAFRPGSTTLAAGFTEGGLALIDGSSGLVIKPPSPDSVRNPTVGLSWTGDELPRLVAIRRESISVWDDKLEVELLRMRMPDVLGGAYSEQLDDVVLLRSSGRVERLSQIGLDADLMR